jgi:hypothetical protein
MSELTITEAELRSALEAVNKNNDAWFEEIIKEAFPPIFKPKHGEVIWVRDGENERWVLRIFDRLFNGKYKCEADNLRKGFDWSQAKPQTPTQKGE